MNNQMPIDKYKILKQELRFQYRLHYSNINGGKVLVHKLVEETDEDFSLLLLIATKLADKGKRVELLPKLHEKEIIFRKIILPGAKTNKNPDLRIDGEYWEVEQPKWPYQRILIRE